MVHDEDVALAFFLFQLQAELIADGVEQTRPASGSELLDATGPAARPRVPS